MESFHESPILSFGLQWPPTPVGAVCILLLNYTVLRPQNGPFVTSKGNTLVLTWN